MGFRSYEIGTDPQITRYWYLVKIENQQTLSRLKRLQDLHRLDKSRFQPILYLREPVASWVPLPTRQAKLSRINSFSKSRFSLLMMR